MDFLMNYAVFQKVLKAGFSFFIKISKAAIELVIKQVVKIKLTSFTLPSLYRPLGEYCYNSAFSRTDFPNQFEQIDKVKAELAIINQQTPPPIQPSFIAKLKALLTKVIKAAQSRMLLRKQSLLFTNLGKVAFEKQGESSGPENLAAPVRDSLGRLQSLESTISAINSQNKGDWVTPKRLAIAGVALLLLFGLVSLKSAAQQMLGEKQNIIKDDFSLIGNKESKLNDVFAANRKPSSSKGNAVKDFDNWGKDLEWELDEKKESQKLSQGNKWESREKKGASPFPTPNFNSSIDTDFPFSDLKEKYKALVNRIRVGMNRSQVESILGLPDEETENDLGEFNPQKAGQILAILTWNGDGAANPAIILGFINNRLTQGGTPGYDISKGFHGKLPSGMSNNEKNQTKKAMKNLGFTVDE
jgi:hypothetical protein